MKIHFIGIGGIGVSAIAKYYLDHGHEITGSDLVRSEITDDLKGRGVKISIGEQEGKIISKNTKLVIFSPAVNQENLELKKSKKLEIKCRSYPEALGEIVKNHYTIAVAGTHGKSTTTCMIGLTLQRAGFDPTVIVGTKLKEFGNSNYRGGKSKYLIIEACEHFESFLNYRPQIIVLTNIEADHLDYYKNLKNVLKGFEKFVSHLPENGILIANRDDKNSVNVARKINRETKYYSLKQPEAKTISSILRVPGSHNVSNALSALAVSRALEIPDKLSLKSFSEFRGSWRRFEEKTVKIKNKNYKVISDYGHHPTEIRVTLDAARKKYPTRKIWCIFQPHQYQRTYYLFDEFTEVFRKAPVDKIIIIDIYDVAGREETKIKKNVSSKKLVDAVKKSNVIYIPTIDESKKYLKRNIKGGEIIVVMGAGDIYNLFFKLV